MQEILLIGGGGHCRSVIDVIEQEGRYKIAGIIDKEEFIGVEVLGYKVVGSDEELKTLRKRYSLACITVGHIYSNSIRVKLFTLLKELAFELPAIVSPLGYLSQHATLGEGSIVMHGAVVNANAKVGKNSIINSQSLLEHDVIVEDNVHISTNVTLNGGVVVKEGSFVGSGVVTKEGVTLDGFIKAGSLIK